MTVSFEKAKLSIFCWVSVTFYYFFTIKTERREKTRILDKPK